MSLSLSAELALATKDAHRLAERKPVAQAILRGAPEARALWCGLLAELAPLYEALEAGLRAHRHVEAHRAFAAPELARSARMRADLEALGAGPSELGPSDPGASPSDSGPGRAAARRIEEIGRTAPDRLLAHAYVRYFGDLAGGRVLLRALVDRHGLDARAGASALSFEDIPDPRAYLEGLRRILDAHPTDAAGRREIIDEALRAFATAGHIFDALAPRGP